MSTSTQASPPPLPSGACYQCRLAHVACGPERPCQQCVRKGRAAECHDAPPRKRGRPSRADPRYISKHMPVVGATASRPAMPPPTAPPRRCPSTNNSSSTTTAPTTTPNSATTATVTTIKHGAMGGSQEDGIMSVLLAEVIRLRQENQQLRLGLTQQKQQSAAGAAAEVEHNKPHKKKKRRCAQDGPMDQETPLVQTPPPAPQPPLPQLQPQQPIVVSSDANDNAALREARIHIPFLQQYRFGTDRPFVLNDLYAKPVCVGERRPDGRCVFTWVNQAFADLLQFNVPQDLGRMIASVSACRPNHRMLSYFCRIQEPWYVSDIMAVSRLLRDRSGRLWRTAANVQSYCDGNGHFKYTLCVFHHWEAGQMLPGEQFEQCAILPLPASSPPVASPTAPGAVDAKIHHCHHQRHSGEQLHHHGGGGHEALPKQQDEALPLAASSMNDDNDVDNDGEREDDDAFLSLLGCQLLASDDPWLFDL